MILLASFLVLSRRMRAARPKTGANHVAASLNGAAAGGAMETVDGCAQEQQEPNPVAATAYQAAAGGGSDTQHVPSKKTTQSRQASSGNSCLHPENDDTNPGATTTPDNDCHTVTRTNKESTPVRNHTAVSFSTDTNVDSRIALGFATLNVVVGVLASAVYCVILIMKGVTVTSYKSVVCLLWLIKTAINIINFFLHVIVFLPVQTFFGLISIIFFLTFKLPIHVCCWTILLPGRSVRLAYVIVRTVLRAVVRGLMNLATAPTCLYARFVVKRVVLPETEEIRTNVVNELTSSST